MGTQNDAVVYSRRGWDILRNQAQVALQAYHNQYPCAGARRPRNCGAGSGYHSPCICGLQRGWPMRSVVDDDGLVHIPDHQVELNERQQADMGYVPVGVGRGTVVAANDRPVEPELLAYLQEKGDVVKVNETVVFTTAAYDDMVAHIVPTWSRTAALRWPPPARYSAPAASTCCRCWNTWTSSASPARVGDERVLR